MAYRKKSNNSVNKPVQVFIRSGYIRALPIMDDGPGTECLRHGWIEIEWPHDYTADSRRRNWDHGVNVNVLLHASKSGIKYVTNDNDRQDGWYSVGLNNENELEVDDHVYFFMTKSERLAAEVLAPVLMALNVRTTLSKVVTVNGGSVFSTTQPCGTFVAPGR